MVLPIILGAVALAGVLGVGVAQGKKAKDTYDEAAAIRDEAEAHYQKNLKQFEKKRRQTVERLSQLTTLRVEAAAGTLERSLGLIAAIHEVKRGRGPKPMPGLAGMPDVGFPEMRQTALQAAELLQGAGVAITAGAAGAASAVGLVTTFGAASTGTAIASLSGVAATNATLAALGGGALSAGGFGIAGGLVTIGGVFAAPVVAVGGIAARAIAERKKTAAEEYATEVEEAVAQITAQVAAMKVMDRRIKEVTDATQSIRDVVGEFSNRVSEAILNHAGEPNSHHAVSYGQLSDLEKADYHRLVLSTKALHALLQVNLFEDDGTPTEASAQAVQGGRQAEESSRT